jgi:hypothetical protein
MANVQIRRRIVERKILIEEWEKLSKVVADVRKHVLGRRPKIKIPKVGVALGDGSDFLDEDGEEVLREIVLKRILEFEQL